MNIEKYKKLVYSTEYDDDGTPDNYLKINVTIDKNVTYKGVPVKIDLSAECDQGYWSFNLLPNSLLIPDNSTYIFEFDDGIKTWKKSVIIPNMNDEFNFDELAYEY